MLRPFDCRVRGPAVMCDLEARASARRCPRVTVRLGRLEMLSPSAYTRVERAKRRQKTHSLGTSGLAFLVGSGLPDLFSTKPLLQPALNSSRETLWSPLVSTRWKLVINGAAFSANSASPSLSVMFQIASHLASSKTWLGRPVGGATFGYWRHGSPAARQRMTGAKQQSQSTECCEFHLKHSYFIAESHAERA